jgi:hypothetical protein
MYRMHVNDVRAKCVLTNMRLLLCLITNFCLVILIKIARVCRYFQNQWQWWAQDFHQASLGAL